MSPLIYKNDGCCTAHLLTKEEINQLTCVITISGVVDSLLGDIASAASRRGASCVTFISDSAVAVPPNHVEQKEEEKEEEKGMTGAF